jgi:hypothetical protein
MDTYITFDAAASLREKDPATGFLHVKSSPLTKEQVAPYLGREVPGFEELGLKPDGVYYALRPAEELAKAAKTFDGIPVLLGHHADSAEAPQKEHRVGSTGTDAEFKAPYLTNSLHITDAAAIEAIENGSCKEISVGYGCDPDLTPGEFQGARYDFVIRGIRANHVALVPKGRAGHDVAVSDGQPEALSGLGKPFNINIAKNERSKNMPKFIENIKKRLLALDEALEKAEVKNPEVAEAVESLKKETVAEAPEKKEAQPEDADPGKDNLPPKAPGPATDSPDTAKLLAMLGDPETAKALAALEGLLKAAKGGGAAAPAQDQSPPKKDDAPAMDSAKEIEAKIRREFRDKAQASAAVKSIIGNIDPLAFDSAESIYAKALEVKGVDPKAYPKEAYKGMVEMIRKEAHSPLALDSFKGEPSTDETLKHLDAIKVI